MLDHGIRYVEKSNRIRIAVIVADVETTTGEKVESAQ